MPDPDRRQATADHKAAIRSAVLDEDAFVRLTLSGAIVARKPPWTRITVRPVVLGGRRHWQFAYQAGDKSVAANFDRRRLARPLEEALTMPFAHIELQSSRGGIHVRITRKGKVLMTRGRAGDRQEIDLAHNRAKTYLLPAEGNGEFLGAIGIADRRGKVRSSMQDKFHQVNEFLRIIDQTVGDTGPAGQPMTIVDCGCGSAYLTFAAYHYLRTAKSMDVHVIGIDVKADIIDKCVALRDSLGWGGLEFAACRIADYQPPARPTAVLSLHACDTATDEAIAAGVTWGSSVILAAPCCQHELHHKLRSPLFQPVIRHGILRERLADLLTDAFRAGALRIMGYRTSVVEFISPEHTVKNLLIRAVRQAHRPEQGRRAQAGLRPGQAELVRQYEALKAFWAVCPVIEEMLGERLAQYLGGDNGIDPHER